ncbi:hypothetical protein HYY75_03030, partial [bacterium]|nr:hypothetical protein [bacterium]
MKIGWLFCLTLLSGVIIFSGCGGGKEENKTVLVKEGVFEDVSIHRGFLSAAQHSNVSSPLMTSVKMLVPDGQKVNPSEVISELSTTKLEDRILEKKANLLVTQANLNKACGLLKFKRSIGESKREKARLEMLKCKEELEKVTEVRDWLKIYEQKVDQKVREEEEKMANRRLKIQAKLEEKGFSAKLDRLSTEKEQNLLELEASYALRLIPWLTDYGAPRDIFKAAQALEQASASFELSTLEAESDEISANIDIESKKNDVAETERVVSKVQDEIASSVIRASVGGIAIRRKTFSGSGWEKISEGDRVFPSVDFLSILNMSKYAVEFYVDQADSSRLALDEAIRFRPDSAQEFILTGKISEFGIMAEE